MGSVVQRGCAIEGCKGRHAGRGLCSKHWARWRRHGDPLAGNTWYYTPEEAFQARIKRVGDCLVWTGAKNKKGYGQIWVGKRKVPTHRYAWERERGTVPEGVVLDHTCYTPACCNIDHLRLATNAENNANRAGAARNNKSSGVRNVYKRYGRWQVRIGKGGKIYNFGVYTNLDEAAAVAKKKRKELFGEFAGKGRNKI